MGQDWGLRSYYQKLLGPWRYSDSPSILSAKDLSQICEYVWKSYKDIQLASSNYTLNKSPVGKEESHTVFWGEHMVTRHEQGSDGKSDWLQAGSCSVLLPVHLAHTWHAPGTHRPRAQGMAPHRAAALAASPARRSHDRGTWETHICYHALYLGSVSQAWTSPVSTSQPGGYYGLQKTEHRTLWGRWSLLIFWDSLTSTS